MSTEPLTLCQELDKIFSSAQGGREMSQESVALLQAQAWLGRMSSEGLRGLCWRVFLGMLKSRTYSGWVEELKQHRINYESLKALHHPSLAKVNDDPLSGYLNEGSQSTEWSDYYKKLEMAELIRVDLDRLYMSGLDDEYFHAPARRERLLTALLVWSIKNEKLGYRQECQAWTSVVCPQAESLVGCFTEDWIESHLYCLFDRVMADMLVLYDPVPITNSNESVPQIVDYCTRIQEHFLRQIDPELCDRLEEAYIQGQIYGLRWARLLLGREFPLTHTHSLRIWDYMFASCMEVSEHDTAIIIEELHSAQSSVSASRAMNERYGSYSRLMGVLGDFMLAMLLHIREKLVNGDSNEVLMLLMKYPATDDVTPIMDLADMLRRGVLNCGAHLGPPPPRLKPSRQKFLQLKRDGKASNSSLSAAGSQENVAGSPPNYILNNPIFPLLNSTTLNNMGRKVTEQLSAVSTAVKTGAWRASSNLQESDRSVDPLLGATVVNRSSQPPTPQARSSSVKTVIAQPIAEKPKSVTQQQEDLLDWILGSTSDRSQDSLTNLIGERLVKIAELLSRRQNNFANWESMENDERIVALQSELVREQALRYEAARRLRLLCDILSGQSPFVSYDSNIESSSLIDSPDRIKLAPNQLRTETDS